MKTTTLTPIKPFVMETGPIPPKPDIRYDWEYVTPDKARDYLARNVKYNRVLREKMVERYAKDLSQQNWKHTAEPVQLALDGEGEEVVLNGQHRFAAIVKSGVGCWMSFARYVEEEVYSVLDSGLTRGAADYLGKEGYTNINVLSASCRQVYLIERKMVDSSAVLSHSMILDVAKRHAKGLQQTMDGIRNDGGEVMVHGLLGKEFIRNARVIACCYWFTRCNREKGLEFTDFLATGAMLPLSSPIYQLLAKLKSAKVAGTLSSKNHRPVFAIMFRAWNAFVAGEEWDRPMRLSRPDEIPWPENGPYLV